MLLRIGSRVRYSPDAIDRMCAADLTARALLRTWIGTIIGWYGNRKAVIQFDGHGQLISYLDYLESAAP